MIRTRRGYTLLEMLLVIALMTTLLAGTIGLLSVARLSKKVGGQNQMQRREIRRLADDLRRDARQSQDFDVGDGKITFKSADADRSVVYEIEPSASISRMVILIGQSNSIKDTYGVGGGRIEFDRLEEHNIVRCTINQADRDENPIRILASGGPPR